MRTRRTMSGWEDDHAQTVVRPPVDPPSRQAAAGGSPRPLPTAAPYQLPDDATGVYPSRLEVHLRPYNKLAGSIKDNLSRLLLPDNPDELLIGGVMLLQVAEKGITDVEAGRGIFLPTKRGMEELPLINYRSRLSTLREIVDDHILDQTSDPIRDKRTTRIRPKTGKYYGQKIASFRVKLHEDSPGRSNCHYLTPIGRAKIHQWLFMQGLRPPTIGHY